MLEPSTSVQYVKGIGPRLADVLGAKGILTVDDLLHYLPFRYEDRVNPRGITELRAGEMASVVGEVRSSGLFRTSKKAMPIFELIVGQLEPTAAPRENENIEAGALARRPALQRAATASVA